MSLSRSKSVGALPARSIAVVAVVAVVLATAGTGCRPLEGPTTEKAKAPVSGRSLEATLSTKPGPEGPWPEKVGRFAASFEGATWYPAQLAEGFEIDSVDVVELEPNTGLVCTTVMLNDGQAIVFTQGSPLARKYGIDPVDTVPWGDTWAQVVHENPADTSSPKMIVLEEEGTLCELSGTVGFDALEAMAASMTRVQ